MTTPIPPPDMNANATPEAADPPAEASAPAAPPEPAPPPEPALAPLPPPPRASPIGVGGWRDHAIGAGIGTLYILWLLVTARSLGFSRDEGFYFRAGRQYVRFYDLLFARNKEAFEQSTIDSIFSYNHEHPALAKSLFGLSWEYLHEKWHVFEDASTAFRFPGMVWAGIALWITYLLGARAYGRWAGGIAAALLALMPRVFYNSHLACFDVPIMSMWTLSVYVYWRATKERTIPWALLCGVVYGLTLLTKHNAWFLPFVYVAHSAVVYGGSFLRDLKGGRITLPGTLVATAIIAPLVFYAGWPWIWNDTVARVREYVEFHMNHEYYNMEFLGRNYNSAPSPRAYVPVMIFATVPGITLALFALGGFDRLRVLALRVADGVRAEWRTFREDPKDSPSVTTSFVTPGFDPPVAEAGPETDLLFFLALSGAVAIWLRPSTPIFGGTKHWLPAYPFLALFAGRGFVVTLHALRRAWPGLAARAGHGMGAALAFVVLLGPLLITAHSHPFGLSAYVPFVGGTAGGADLGLNRQFWGFTTQSVGPWLAKNAPRGASVFFHDTTFDAWQEMQEEGRIPQSLRGAGGPSDADFSIIQHELHMNELDYEIWIAYGDDAPVYVLTQDNVPIISVYRRGARPRE